MARVPSCLPRRCCRFSQKQSKLSGHRPCVEEAETVPYKILAEPFKAVQTVVRQRLEVLSQQGQELILGSGEIADDLEGHFLTYDLGWAWFREKGTNIGTASR